MSFITAIFAFVLFLSAYQVICLVNNVYFPTHYSVITMHCGSIYSSQELHY